MRSPLKALLITGSIAAAILGAALPATTASAAEVAPTLSTTNFACSNGVCEIGPGNVGMSFAAGLYATAPSSPTFLITLAVEVTDTDQSALMLASYPSISSVDVCPFQPAFIPAGRSELPVPMAMVSCWVPDGP